MICNVDIGNVVPIEEMEDIGGGVECNLTRPHW
jgi:hypothetical protein